MNKKLMSENLKEEIAKELGVYEQVKQDGGSWANVSSKDCGNIVKKAIEIANKKRVPIFKMVPSLKINFLLLKLVLLQKYNLLIFRQVYFDI